MKHYSNNDALVYIKEFRKEVWSYDELYHYADRITGLFYSLKIKKGDKVIIYAYNSPDWCAILLACALSGVTAVPIDFNSKPEFAETIKKKVKAKAIFGSMYKKVSNKDLFVEDLLETVEPFSKYRCKTKIKEDDLLEIVYTSGTTSEPKGVMITNKNIASNVRSLRKAMIVRIYLFLQF